MELQISDASRQEASEFTEREWPHHPTPPGVHWERFDVALVARRDVVVGAAIGVVIGGLGELQQLLVRRGDERTGVGSLLLREFEQRCRARNCHKLRLETADYQARPFYERHGFRVAATLANDRFGHTWFIMEKALDSA